MKYYISDNSANIISSIINKTITSISINSSAIVDGCFGKCILLSEVFFPKCKQVQFQAFLSCSSLETATFLQCYRIYSEAFIDCTALSSLYLLSPFVCNLISTNAFWNTPLYESSYLGYYGSIYVPASLVNDYKSATNWTYYSNRITAFES